MVVEKARHRCSFRIRGARNVNRLLHHERQAVRPQHRVQSIAQGNASRAECDLRLLANARFGQRPDLELNINVALFPQGADSFIQRLILEIDIHQLAQFGNAELGRRLACQSVQGDRDQVPTWRNRASHTSLQAVGRVSAPRVQKSLPWT